MSDYIKTDLDKPTPRDRPRRVDWPNVFALLLIVGISVAIGLGLLRLIVGLVAPGSE